MTPFLTEPQFPVANCIMPLQREQESTMRVRPRVSHKPVGERSGVIVEVHLEKKGGGTEKHPASQVD